MAQPGNPCAIVQMTTENETDSPSPTPSKPGPLAAWLESLPSWSETTERVQELSQSTVESFRKNAAATLRASADVLQDASANTASKMREVAPWVEGEVSPTLPLVRVEDLSTGDAVFRKGLPATFIQADHDGVIVRMEETGNEISTDFTHVSLGVDASQAVLCQGLRVCLVGLHNKPELNGCHAVVKDFQAEAQRWNVKLDSTEEVLCANPWNLSALVSFSTAAPKSTLPQLQAGVMVRLEGLQNRPKLNGCYGMVVEDVAQTKRWNVKLVNTAEVVCVHSRNIFVVNAANGPAPEQK